MREEEENSKLKNKKQIEKRMKKNQLYESFLAVPFTEIDSEYGDKDEKGTNKKIEEENDETCPDILIHRGDVIALYNSKSENHKPLQVFKNLDEYVDYVKKMQEQGKYCPVLYLRQEIDLQGRDVYRLYPYYHPPQLPIYDEYSEVNNKKKKKCKSKSQLKPMASENYPIIDGQAWNLSRADEEPSIPLPPPFLKSISAWDLHHMPPLYIEGGMPPIPVATIQPLQHEIPYSYASGRDEKDQEPSQEDEGDNNQEQSPEEGGDNNEEQPSPEDNAHAQDQAPTNNIPQPQSQKDSSYVGYDPYTLSENVFVSTEDPTTAPPGQFSDNAYDTHWGGITYTMANIEAGKYDNNMVKSALYPNLGFV